MSDVSLHQFLVLYTWFPLAALLLFQLLIARFYEKFSGERTHFWLYGVVVILFGAAAVRYASIGIALNDSIRDSLELLAGVLLLSLCALLHRRMLIKKSGKQL